MRKANTILIFLFLLNTLLLAQPSPFIHVDQFGYHLAADKVAVLSDPQTGYNAGLSYNPPATIELRDATTHSVDISAPPLRSGTPATPTIVRATAAGGSIFQR
jgi:hypothetical protein